MSVDLIVHILLWVLGFLFFYYVPVCGKRKTKITIRPTVSVVIPARNEETTIPNLLRSLKAQLKTYDEIIVVDDHSEDNTGVVAEREGAKVITSKEMPLGWTGKAWACYQGAQVASGTLLIFLDADTIIEEGGLDRIISTHGGLDGVLSIQPYHKMRKLYEELSAFFNLVLMAAMGSFTILGNVVRPIGLFGPVLILETKQYRTSGGFEKVKGEILEDLAFGAEFKKQGVKIYCYGGRGTVSFRMYPGGMSQLITGWSKGFAKGAVQTSIPVLILIIGWITGAFGTTRNLIQVAIISDYALVFQWGLLYIAYACQLYWMLRRIGNFRPYTALLFPIPLLFFVLVFIYSFLIIFIRRNVTWKGRAIKVSRRGEHAGSSADSDHNNN